MTVINNLIGGSNEFPKRSSSGPTFDYVPTEQEIAEEEAARDADPGNRNEHGDLCARCELHIGDDTLGSKEICSKCKIELDSPKPNQDAGKKKKKKKTLKKKRRNVKKSKKSRKTIRLKKRKTKSSYKKKKQTRKR